MVTQKLHWWHKALYITSAAILIFLYVFESNIRFHENDYGSDFFAYWSAGKVADIYGYSSIYDFELNKQVQLETVENLGLDVDNFTFFPVVYFSVFLIPFQFLSRFSLPNSYYLWSALNWLVLIGYFSFFFRSALKDSNHFSDKLLLTLVLIFTFPTFFNIVWGQVNTILAVGLGESIRNVQKGRLLIGGLCLGLLILKFPLLILLIPALFFLKNYRILIGLIISSVMFILVSTIVVGLPGTESMLRFWMGTVQVSAPTAPDVMMNWRMLGTLLQGLIPDWLNWIIVIGGSLITIYLVGISLKKRPEVGSSEWVMAIMGVMACTCVVSWHSHIHTAIILLPFLIYNIANGQLDPLFTKMWIVAPPIFLLLLVIIAELKIPTVRFNYLSQIGTALRFFYFIFNIYICNNVLRFFLKRS